MRRALWLLGWTLHYAACAAMVLFIAALLWLILVPEVCLHELADAAAPSSTPFPPLVAAPMGPAGAAVVWANRRSRLYHRPGTRWFGRTADGMYTTEASAVASGYRAAQP